MLRRKHSTLVLFLLLLCTTSGAQLCGAQGQNLSEPSQRVARDTIDTPVAGSDDDKEDSSQRFSNYAFLNNYVIVSKTRIANFLRRYGLSNEQTAFTSTASNSRMAFRPFIHWTRWANKKMRFGPVFAFMLLSSILCWLFLPNQLTAAANECSAHYWRCSGTGILVTTLLVSCIRFVLMTELGWPLGVLLTGILQMLLLFGLAVLGSLIGKTAVFYLKVSSWPLISRHSAYVRWVELVLGVLTLALLLQLGSPFGLPRLGTRLVALLAIVGIGGIYRVVRRAQTRAD